MLGGGLHYYAGVDLRGESTVTDVAVKHLLAAA